ncbi:hypothetical protein SDC9_78364 [bioreactor metagenome]|uniref:Uncharacterized protein n=1 Tax=bioreactor metagenome TaxID=1076179 RepID=A0A644YU26_9ZZZZ
MNEHHRNPVGAVRFEHIQPLHPARFFRANHVSQIVERQRIMHHIRERRGKIHLQWKLIVADLGRFRASRIEECDPGGNHAVFFVEIDHQSGRNRLLFGEANAFRVPGVDSRLGQTADQRRANSETASEVSQIFRPEIGAKQKSGETLWRQRQFKARRQKRQALPSGSIQRKGKFQFQIAFVQIVENFRDRQVINPHHGQAFGVVRLQVRLIDQRQIGVTEQRGGEKEPDAHIRVPFAQSDVERAVRKRSEIFGPGFFPEQFFKRDNQRKGLVLIGILKQEVPQQIAGVL